MKNNRTKTAVMTESEESDDEFSILNCSTKKDRKNNSFKKATQKKSSKIKVKKEVDEGCKKVDRAAVPAVSNEHRTPKCQPLNSKALIEKRQIKRHQRNIFEGCEAEKKEEGEDPFNFDSKKDELPIFFESVNNNNKQRPCYNDIKSFINTPNITVKMGDEKQKLVSASSKKSSLSETPKISSNITGKKTTTPAIKKRKAPNESETPAKLAKVETNNVQTSVKKPLPKIEEEIPVLNAEEQVVADDESNTFYPKGARVFAFYNKAYYPAIIDEFDGLGRYKIFFTEDNSKRTVPRDGIFPLHFVKEDMQVTVLGEYDEENRRIVYDGKIVAIPSLKNIEEWHRGIFTIEVTNNDHPEPESRQIEWIDIFFDEVQYKRSKKNFTTNNQENNIGSRRRTRPSTALAASTATPKPPVTIPMPTSSSDIEKNGNDVKAEDTSREPKENSEVSSSSGGSKSPFKIFDKLQFILTSANRESGPRPFAKREVRKQIESRGGNVVETFESMNPDLTTYLIADTFYRTHKYLTALSLSVPTVSFKWINKCVEENKLVDYNDFMLDAGESETTGEVYKWQSLKGKILGGKKIIVFSKREMLPGNTPVDFRQIWGPMIVNLGGELVDNYPSEHEKAIEFFKTKNTTDYFVADDGATPQDLINAVIEGGAIAVTSEWVIQTVITGLLATTSGDESYMLHSK